MTNIIQAVRNNNIALVKSLLTSTPDLINARDGDSTLLSLAVDKGYLDMVKILISRGADINREYGGYHALSMAIEDNNHEMIALLLDLGADINKGELLPTLARNNNIELFNALLSQGLHAGNKKGYSALQIASKQDNIAFVQSLLAANVLTISENRAEAPLINAIKNGNIEMVRLLVNTADSNVRFLEMPALMWAAKDGKSEIVNILLENNADANITYNGQTALMLAFQRNHPEVARALINAGADFVTSLTIHYSNHADNERSFALFLNEAGADLNIIRNEKTPLMRSSADGNAHLVTALINAGVDLDKQNNNGDTALTIAIDRDHSAIAAILINAGVDLDKQNNNGNTALMIAINTDHSAIAAILINAGVDLDKQNNNGNTALMIAINTDHSAIAEMLINAGVDLDKQNNNGNTALMIAINTGHIDIAEMLLNNNASALTINNNGLNALDYVNNIEFIAQNTEDDQVFMISALTECTEYANNVSNFLYNNIALGVEIIPDHYASLRDFYEVNKKDLSITYTNRYHASPDFVNAEIVIKQAYQAIQSNYLFITGVSKEGLIPELNSDIENHIFSYLVSKEISDGASKILPPRANILPAQNLVNEGVLEEADDIEEVFEADDIEEVLGAAVALHAILANAPELPNDNMIVNTLVPDNEVAEDVLASGGMVWHQGEINETAAFTTPTAYDDWRFGNNDDESPLKRQRLFGEFNEDENDYFANLVGIAAPAADAMDIA